MSHYKANISEKKPCTDNISFIQIPLYQNSYYEKKKRIRYGLLYFYSTYNTIGGTFK